MLERLRFVALSDAKMLAFSYHDLDLAPGALAGASASGDGDVDVMGQALHSRYAQSTRPPLYIVARDKRYEGLGHPIYEDEYVAIYSIDRD